MTAFPEDPMTAPRPDGPGRNAGPVGAYFVAAAAAGVAFAAGA